MADWQKYQKRGFPLSASNLHAFAPFSHLMANNFPNSAPCCLSCAIGPGGRGDIFLTRNDQLRPSYNQLNGQQPFFKIPPGGFGVFL